MYDDDLAKLEQRIITGLRTGRVRELRSNWTARTGLPYWLGYLMHSPAEFAYTVPRRIACRVLRRHNPTCIGRLNHPRRW